MLAGLYVMVPRACAWRQQGMNTRTYDPVVQSSGYAEFQHLPRLLDAPQQWSQCTRTEWSLNQRIQQPRPQSHPCSHCRRQTVAAKECFQLHDDGILWNLGRKQTIRFAALICTYSVGVMVIRLFKFGVLVVIVAVVVANVGATLLADDRAMYLMPPLTVTATRRGRGGKLNSHTCLLLTVVQDLRLSNSA